MSDADEGLVSEFSWRRRVCVEGGSVSPESVKILVLAFGVIVSVSEVADGEDGGTDGGEWLLEDPVPSSRPIHGEATGDDSQYWLAEA